MEDRDRRYTYSDVKAVKVFKKGMDSIKKILEDFDTEPNLQTIILGCLHLIWMDRSSPTAFGTVIFGDGLTLPGIMRDQERIGWLDFISAHWSMKWK